jgi:hypothetical protein
METPADEVVSLLRSFVAKGEYGLSEVPALLRQVIDGDLWRDRVIAQTGELAHFNRFTDFVHTPPLAGLGADMDTLRRLCADDTTARDALDRVTKAESRQGERVDLLDNVQEVERLTAPTGNRADRALRKLRKDRPDLHAQVLAGEMSPNAAMVEAGFRRRSITVPADVEGHATAIRRHYSAQDVALLVKILTST